MPERNETNIDLGQMFGGAAKERHATKKEEDREQKRKKLGGGAGSSSDSEEAPKFEDLLSAEIKKALKEDSDIPDEKLEERNLVERLHTMGYHPIQTRNKSLGELRTMSESFDRGLVQAQLKKTQEAYRILKQRGFPDKTLFAKKDTELIRLATPVDQKISPAESTKNSLTSNSFEIERLRAMAVRVGANVKVESDEDELRQALIKRQEELVKRALKINPDQKNIGMLYPLQLMEYLRLAKPGQTFSEVAKTEEYRKAFEEFSREQQELEQSYALAHGVVRSVPEKQKKQEEVKDFELGTDIRTEEAEVADTRAGSLITLARLNKYDDLNAESEKAGDKIFAEKTRELWKEFAVHGVVSRDKKSGEPVILAKADLDGRTVAGLLHLAGIDIPDVKYVAPGDSRENRINFDTGNKNGVVVERGGQTAYIDHHTTDVGSETSAAKLTYELMTKLGLLERKPELDKLVDFVTKSDNMSFPAKAYGKGSERTLVGLRRNLTFRQLLRFMQEGVEPETPLSDERLKQVTVYLKRDRKTRQAIEKQTLFDRSQNRLHALEKAEARLKEMEQSGLILDSKDYGKVVVDINGTLPTGTDAAKAYGAGMYLVWNPEQQSFFISTFNGPINHKFAQGFQVRDTMWMKPPTDKEQLNLKLEDLLKELAGQEVVAAGALEAFFRGQVIPTAGEVYKEPEPMTEEEAQEVMLGRDPQKLSQEREGQDMLLGKVSEKEGEDMLLGRNPADIAKEIEAQDAFLGKQIMSEREARDVMLGKVDLEEGEKKLIDTFLGPEEKEKTAETKENKEGKIEFKAHAIELSEYVERYAMRQAQEQFRETFDKSGFLRRMFLQSFEDYHVARQYDEIRKSISENKNLMVLLEARVTGKVEAKPGSSEESYKVIDAILEAYVNDLGILEHEKGEEIKDDSELNKNMGELFYLAAKEGWDRGRFDKELGGKLAHYKGKFSKKELTSEVFASDLWKYAETYKDQIGKLIESYGPENEEACRQHICGLMNVDLQLGRKDADIRAEPKKLGPAEKFLIDVQNRFLGRTIANPFVIGSVASLLARGIAKGKLSKSLTTATAVFVAPSMASVIASLVAAGAAGGLYTAFRRGKQVKQDWTQERMQQAMGRGPAGEKAGNFRNYMLDMVDADARAEELSSPTVSKEVVADTIARLELESMQNVQELFRASTENANLGTRLVDMNKLQAALKNLRSNPEFSDEQLKELVGSKKSELQKEIDQKEKIFDKFKRDQKIRAGLTGGAMAIAGAVASQELIYRVKEGLEHVGVGHGGGDTIAHKLIRGNWVKHYPAKLELSDGIHTIPNVEATVHTPQGFSFQDHGNGTSYLAYKGEYVADNLKYDSHGKLLEESKNVLRGLGFNITEQSHTETLTVADTHSLVASGEMHAATLQDLQQNYGDSDWSQHQRIDWHHEGPQASNFYERIIEHPGKEQMLYLQKNADGRVTMDAHKIVENLAQNLKSRMDLFVNPDGSVDHKMQELVEKLSAWQEKGELGRHIQAVVLPDKHSALSSVFGADNNGRAVLSESLSKLCTPEDLKDGKLPFTIELRLDDGHVLATASNGGNGMMFETMIERIAPKIPTTLEISDTYLRPPIYDEMEPMLATPMAKRYHLETVKIKPIIPPPSERKTERIKEAPPEKIADWPIHPKVSEKVLADLPLHGEREPVQMEFEPKMHIIAEGEILRDVRKAITSKGDARKTLERVLNANYDLFMKYEGDAGKDGFAQFVLENFKLRPPFDWNLEKKWGRTRVVLAKNENVSKLVEGFDKAMEKASKAHLKQALKDMEHDRIPKLKGIRLP